MSNFLNILSNSFAPHLLVMDMIRSIVENIEGFFKDTLNINTETFLNWASEYLLELPYFAQLGVLVLLAIIIIMGTFALIKAVAKIMVVLAILLAIGILFQQGVFGALIVF